MNLNCPARWHEAEIVWSALCRNLNSALREIVAERSDGALQQTTRDLETWRAYFESPKQSDKLLIHQWETAQAMLWCARHAGQPPQVRNEVEYAHWATTLPESLRGRAGWALDCIRLLDSGNPSPVRVRRTQTSVALSDVTGPKQGPLASLTLDILEPGGGQVLQHPEFSLFTVADKGFTDSLRNAWQAARETFPENDPRRLGDLRWRLIGQDGQIIKKIEGPSASGAAGMVSLLTLREQLPDDHLIVLGECRENRRLISVGDLAEKTKAIAGSEKFDTIIVPNDTDAQTVSNALPKRSTIRVRVATTLNELAEQRSLLAEEVERYCTRLIENLDKTPWFRQGKNILASAVAVPVRVLKESTRPEPPERDRLREGPGDEPDDRHRREPACEYVDAEVAALYEEAIHEGRREEVPWQQERLLTRRAVVLGCPGGGKSFLTQTTGIDLSRTALAAVQQRRVRLEALSVPIHLRLPEFADRKLPSNPAATVLKLVREAFTPAPCFLDWLDTRLRSNTTWLLLDSLDEVPADCQKALTQRLRAIDTQGWQTRVLFTCRPANYVREVIPWAEVTEYELATFTPLEIRHFVQRWFSSDQERMTKLIQVLDRSYPLAHAARVPLLASFLCSAHEHNSVTLSTRRNDLYKQVLLDLLSRRYKGHHVLDGDDPHVRAMFKFLVRVARPLFELHPSGNLFTYSEIETVFLATEDRPSAQVLHRRLSGSRKLPDNLLLELRELGILVKAGLGEKDKPQFSFAHRSLLEYLVARNLNEEVELNEAKLNGSGWKSIEKLVDKKSWHPAWQEVVIFLAGMLNDPLPLLAMLADESTDDFTRQRLCLAGRCLAELSSQALQAYKRAVQESRKS